VLKSLFGKAKELYEKKQSRYSRSKTPISNKKETKQDCRTNGLK